MIQLKEELIPKTKYSPRKFSIRNPKNLNRRQASIVKISALSGSGATGDWELDRWSKLLAKQAVESGVKSVGWYAGSAVLGHGNEKRVASIKEALTGYLYSLGLRMKCVLFHGSFSQEEAEMVEKEKGLNEAESNAPAGQIEQGTEGNKSCDRSVQESEKSEKLATEEVNRQPEFAGSK